ncbi:MAG: hypothetical protein IJM35_09950 [Bacteroidales bacterium]|nr:hypothetical protein [Bacteroidales bacterium]
MPRIEPVKENKSSLMNKNGYDEFILAELREKCHPKNFMQPYDFEKVNIANELYSMLLKESIPSEDLYSIRRRAINELGISIDTTVIFDELSSICNPENFMQPYDAVKVSIANKLYSRILENKSNVFELEKIRKEAIKDGIIEEKDLNDGEQIRIIGVWNYQNGKLIRLVQRDNNTVFYLETGNDNDWNQLSLLKFIKEDIQFLAQFIEDNAIDHKVDYQISRVDSSLQVLLDGNIICRYSSIILNWELAKYTIEDTTDKSIPNNVTEVESLFYKNNEQNQHGKDEIEHSQDGNKELQRVALVFVLVLVVCMVLGRAVNNESSNSYNDTMIQNTNSILSTRTTTQYSILYPFNWRVKEKPDSISDVYIGAEGGDIGFTILYFDSGYSIDRVNSDGLKSMRKAGMSVVSNDKVSINGYSGYKTVYDFSFNETDCRQISYTIKNGKTVYNIKFGNNRYIIDQNLELIEKIINSFNIN